MSQKIKELESSGSEKSKQIEELTRQRDDMRDAIELHAVEMLKFQQTISDLEVTLNEVRSCEVQLTKSLDISDSKFQKVRVLFVRQKLVQKSCKCPYIAHTSYNIAWCDGCMGTFGQVALNHLEISDSKFQMVVVNSSLLPYKKNVFNPHFDRESLPKFSMCFGLLGKNMAIHP